MSESDTKLSSSCKSTKSKSKNAEDADVRIAIPTEFFKYSGPGDAEGNSVYRCLKCPVGIVGKTVSCSNKSRFNLKKHVMVSFRVLVF